MAEFDTNIPALFKILTIIHDIDARQTGFHEKPYPRFLFRGESQIYELGILPKYLRSLCEDGANAEKQYPKDEFEIL